MSQLADELASNPSWLKGSFDVCGKMTSPVNESLDSILEKHPDIGLIGPGNGILTTYLDGIFKRSKVLCTQPPHLCLITLMNRDNSKR